GPLTRALHALSLHAALPIFVVDPGGRRVDDRDAFALPVPHDALIEHAARLGELGAVIDAEGGRRISREFSGDRLGSAAEQADHIDRKSTRLNSRHVKRSYAV